MDLQFRGKRINKKNSSYKILHILIKDFLSKNHDCLGFFEFGTLQERGGSDVDLWAIFENKKIPSIDKQKEIITKLESSGCEVHLFFLSLKQFEMGKMDYPGIPSVYYYLGEGLDHHHKQASFEDASLLFLFIYSTMRSFILQEEKKNELLSAQKKGLKAIKLSQTSVFEWTHYYAACFLNHYFNSRKLSTKNYSVKLAKFLIRVALGNILKDLEKRDLFKVKQSLIKAFQQNSPDKGMVDFIFDYENLDYILSINDRKLLSLACKIRCGTVSDADGFNTQAEALAFYLTFQQGITVRQKAEGKVFDPFSCLTFEVLIKHLEDQGIVKKEIIVSGEQFITKGEKDDLLYYVPLKRKRNDVWQKNGSCLIVVQSSQGKTLKIPKGPGRLIGELGPLFAIPRTASVIAVENLKVYKIKGEFFRNLLFNKELMFQLKTKEFLDTQEARLLDILLRYLFYESGFLLRDQALYKDAAAGLEDYETIKKDNPLIGYYLGNKFLEIIEKTCSLMIHPIKTKELDNGILFNKGGKTGDNFFVVSCGKVILDNIGLNPSNIILEKGAVFGEASLLGEKTRSGRAVLQSRAVVYAINADLFKKFSNSRKKIIGTDFLAVNLFYHLTALNFGRVRRKLKSGTPESNRKSLRSEHSALPLG